jgi:hypothetical protein
MNPIGIDMGTTGIGSINDENVIESAYDLGGRKIESMNPDRKGIYIINGQKQAVK